MNASFADSLDQALSRLFEPQRWVVNKLTNGNRAAWEALERRPGRDESRQLSSHRTLLGARLGGPRLHRRLADLFELLAACAVFGVQGHALQHGHVE